MTQSLFETEFSEVFTPAEGRRNEFWEKASDESTLRGFEDGSLSSLFSSLLFGSLVVIFKENFRRLQLRGGVWLVFLSTCLGIADGNGEERPTLYVLRHKFSGKEKWNITRTSESKSRRGFSLMEMLL